MNKKQFKATCDILVPLEIDFIDMDMTTPTWFMSTTGEIIER